MASLLASRNCASRCARVRCVRAVQPRVSVAPVLRGRRVITFAAVDKEQVLNDTLAIIVEQLGLNKKEEKVKLTAESSFVDIGADSLDTVEIMMALEEKFNLELDEEGAEKIGTIGEAVDLIVAQLEAK